jgi:arylsulfatase A-like enzyme
MRVRLTASIIIMFLISSCGKEEMTTGNPSVSDPNILLIIADDMGLDASPGFELGSIKPDMPNLQNFIDSGLTFSNLWSNPTCTPTRSSIITGKYGFRTGVTKVGDVLSTTETSLQSYIKNNVSSSYNTAVIGKWHLSNDANHPTNMGVDYYAGLLSGGVQSYTNWMFTENGESKPSNEYTTTKITDVAINWINEQEDPWFLWLAYNAPHTPFHLPPENLHNQGSLPDDQASIDANPLPYYMAMLEALDSEMGRLLNTLSSEELANTTIIFIGDNGTPNQVAQEYNSNRVKGSVYQGGINVPMYIKGKGVLRINQLEEALINTTDLFATIAQIAGGSSQIVNDSHSFVHLLNEPNGAERQFVYSEIEKDIGETDYTIRDATHKYIFFGNGEEALYNLNQNPMENPNLLNPNQLPLSDPDNLILSNLKVELEKIRG